MMLNNDNNKTVVPISDNIFDKIKKIFKGIFGQPIYNIYENNIEQNINEDKENVRNPIFAETIKVEEDMNQRLLRLQKLIREKRISENELGDEDKANLRKLYETQIEELRTSILQKRCKIMKIKYDKKRKAHANNL